MEHYFIGIDIGTQGARVVLLSDRGELVSEQKQDFKLNEKAREEQSPEEWWDTCVFLLKKMTDKCRREVDLGRIKAIGVTSTSGTVIPLGENESPIHDALMYSDTRAASVADECKQAAVSFFKDRDQNAYTGFNASSGLCKIVWFNKTFPEKANKVEMWAHAADFITGRLSGVFGVSDYTNALKSGFDIFTKIWPEYLFSRLGLGRNILPNVVAPGAPVGFLKADLAHRLGLSEKIAVVAGMTDGCASQIASGAAKLGDWNTTIGTTMVIKGVTKDPIMDPQGRLYNHLHPEGFFMPGGAGNTGADWITLNFKEDIEELNKRAERLTPTGMLAWPLKTKGERFPFVAPNAEGFLPEGLSKEEQFTANLEGVAYIERYAYEMIAGLSGEKIKAVYTAGGGSNSDIWLKIRSSVLNVPIYKMKYVSGAVGAAILAASQTAFSSLSEAVSRMTQKEKSILPNAAWAEQYQISYLRFVEELEKKGFLR